MFRRAAVESRGAYRAGGVFRVTSITLRTIVVISSFTVLLLMAFLFSFKYTNRTTVPGMLIPDGGVVKVFSTQAGVVIDAPVVDGQRVLAGDTLVLVSGDNHSVGVGETQQAIIGLLTLKDQNLTADIKSAYELQAHEHQHHSFNIRMMENQLAHLKKQVGIQSKQVKISEDSLLRHEALLKKKYVSFEQVQEKKSALLLEMSNLQALERNKIMLLRELAAAEIEIKKVSNSAVSKIADLKRQSADNLREIAESEERKSVKIRAPHSGKISSILVSPGQSVGLLKPLLIMARDGKELFAELYVPGRAIGFIKVGDRVALRYRAYPYQKFGVHFGTVRAVASVALAGDDLASYGGRHLANSNESIFFKVIVIPDSQVILKPEGAKVLQAGMLVEADIMHENLRLYEWLLEPLIRLSRQA